MPFSPTSARPVLFHEYISLINSAHILISLLIFNSLLHQQKESSFPHQSASCTHPDWGLNPQPSRVQDDSPTIRATHPRLNLSFIPSSFPSCLVLRRGNDYDDLCPSRSSLVTNKNEYILWKHIIMHKWSHTECTVLFCIFFSLNKVHMCMWKMNSFKNCKYFRYTKRCKYNEYLCIQPKICRFISFLISSFSLHPRVTAVLNFMATISMCTVLHKYKIPLSNAQRYFYCF